MRTHHIPLYQSVFVFTREVYRLRSGFPKSFKHDLGQEVCESSIKLLKCVVLANSAVKKEQYLSRLVLEIEVQWVLLRLLYELRAISAGQFKLLSERLADITKQSQAWLKWVRTKANKKPGSILPVKKTLAKKPQITL